VPRLLQLDVPNALCCSESVPEHRSSAEWDFHGGTSDTARLLDTALQSDSGCSLASQPNQQNTQCLQLSHLAPTHCGRETHASECEHHMRAFSSAWYLHQYGYDRGVAIMQRDLSAQRAWMPFYRLGSGEGWPSAGQTATSDAVSAAADAYLSKPGCFEPHCYSDKT
jgi:hypothetical protein